MASKTVFPDANCESAPHAHSSRSELVIGLLPLRVNFMRVEQTLPQRMRDAEQRQQQESASMTPGRLVVCSGVSTTIRRC